MHRLLLLAAAALALSGCTGTESKDSASSFKGAEADVAKVVDELKSAGRSKNAEKICSDVLSPVLVAELKSGGSDCIEEMTKAIGDADDYQLEVRDVAVTGDRASARVQQGEDGRRATLELARENGAWRVTKL